MKIIYFLLTVLCLSFTDSSTSLTQEKQFTLKGNIQYYNTIIQGIRTSDLPAKTANQLIDDISSQINKQLSDTTKKK